MPTQIVLCYPVEAKHIEQIAAVMPEAEIVDAGQEQIAEELFRADIFCGHAKVPVDWDGVVRQGRLRWIQSSAAGMDHCLVPSVIESDIVVTSASGVLADQVAEHTIALVTGWCRSLPTFFRAPAEEGVHPPAHPRPDPAARWASWASAATAGDWPNCSRLRHSHPGHRHVPGRQAGRASRPSGRPIGWTICCRRSISSCCACR